MINSTEERVLHAIDRDSLVSSLCELIAIPSVGGQEGTAQEWVAALLKRWGLDVDVWNLDFESLRQHPAYSAEVEREQGLGIAGIMGQDSGGRSLILNGHVDVVPPGDDANWRHPPWRGTLEEGNIYGRGSADMKGGLCCALFAAKAVIDSGVRLRGRLFIESVVGEEDGGAGTLAAVLRGYRADGAIIMEPTELKVAPAQAGSLHFRVTVPGHSAHGCMREEGLSAIEKFIPVYQALMELERERNEAAGDPLFADYKLPYALSVGTVRAGNWAASVPEQLVFEGRYGMPVGEKVAEARRRFEQSVQDAAQADPWLAEHPPEVAWWGGQFGPASTATDHPLVETMSAAYSDVSGSAAQVRGMTYGADMRLLVNEGQTPTLMFGPGDIRRAHRPNEYVPMDELITCTQAIALTILRFCGYDEAH
jgi:acetylornithine deacetylase